MSLKVLSLGLLISVGLISAQELPENCQPGSRALKLSGESGEISTPGFGSGEDVEDGIGCAWSILPDPEFAAVRLHFTFFDMAHSKHCGGNRLLIGTALNSSEPQPVDPIKIICGDHIPRDIHVPLNETRQLTLHFGSGAIGFHQGFHLVWNRTNAGPCADDHLACVNRKCVPLSVACDGNDDCGDATDESREHCETTPPKNWSSACGTPEIPPTFHQQGARLLGGASARRGSWPWMVDMQNSMIEPNAHFCGGVLIHPQFVMTAAHCIAAERDPKKVKLIFGNHHAFEEDDSEQVRYLENYVIYDHGDELLNMSVFSSNPEIHYPWGGDIGIIKLHAPVELNEYVHPICLPADDHLPEGSVCHVTGWGASRGTGGSDVLKQLRVRIRGHCELFNSKPFDNETMVCTYHEKHGFGPCGGDSGGPLNCRHEDGKWFLHGVASMVVDSNYLSQLCAIGSEETVYNRVGEKLDWVARSIRYLMQSSGESPRAAMR